MLPLILPCKCNAAACNAESTSFNGSTPNFLIASRRDPGMNCVGPCAPALDVRPCWNPDSPDVSFNNNAAPDNGFPVNGFRYLAAIASTDGP